MNYGYDSTDPLWKGRRTGVLAERLKEIAGLYNAPIQVTEEVLVRSGVTLRRLTNLSKNDLLNLIEVADRIFVEVMSPELTPEEEAAEAAEVAAEEAEDARQCALDAQAEEWAEDIDEHNAADADGRDYECRPDCAVCAHGDDRHYGEPPCGFCRFRLGYRG